MTAAGASPYPRIDGMHPMIARINFGERPVRARGRFDVRHGPSLLARIAVRLLRMPPAGRDLPFTLSIDRRSDVDIWRRTFAGARPFVTRQPRGLWPPVDRFGPFELAYHADVQADRLTLRSASVRVRIDPIAFPLPAWLRPRDLTVVSAEGALARVRVAIELPFVGPLLSYDGVVEEVN